MENEKIECKWLNKNFGDGYWICDGLLKAVNEEWKKYGNSKELQDMYNFLQSLLRKEFPVTITKEELEKRWKE